MYAIVCCIRAIGPIGGRPVDFISTPTTDRTVDQASGRETWWGSVHYFFFRFFFPPFLQTVRVPPLRFFCAAFASWPPWRTSPLLCNKNNSRDNVSFAAFLCLRFFTFAFLPRDIVPFQRFLFLLYRPPALCLIRFVFIGCFVFKAVTSSRFEWLNVSMDIVCLKASAWMFDSIFV